MTRKCMEPDDLNDELARIIVQAALYDDGAAAKEHLAAGRAIYYSDGNTPPNMVMKEYPDGRREFVRFDLDGEHCIQKLASHPASDQNS